MEADVKRVVVKIAPNLRFNGFTDAWRSTLLEDWITSIDSGWSPTCMAEPANEAEWGSLKTTAISWNGYDPKENKKLPDNLNPQKSLEVHIDDLLITRVGPKDRVGVVVHVNDSRGRLMVSENMFRVKLREGVNPSFLPLVLGAVRVQKSWKERTAGLASAQVVLNQKTLNNTRLYLPFLPEQQKIAAFLGSVDRKIHQLKRKQALLEQYKQGAMQQLFTQELRFKRKDGGEFPEWAPAPLEELFTASKGFGLSKDVLKQDGKHKCLLYGELFTRYKEVITTALSSTDSPEGLPSEVGDILMPNSTTTTGVDLAKASALLEGDVRLGGDVTALRLKVPGDSRFWAYYITHHLNTEIAKYAQGITIVHLSFNNFKEMTVPYPTLEEQSRIAGFLMALDAKVAGVARAVAAAQKWKKGLLQQMFV
jgi:type I restriction enzyme S subunit